MTEVSNVRRKAFVVLIEISRSIRDVSLVQVIRQQDAGKRHSQPLFGARLWFGHGNDRAREFCFWVGPGRCVPQQGEIQGRIMGLQPQNTCRYISCYHSIWMIPRIRIFAGASLGDPCPRFSCAIDKGHLRIYVSISMRGLPLEQHTL